MRSQISNRAGRCVATISVWVLPNAAPKKPPEALYTRTGSALSYGAMAGGALARTIGLPAGTALPGGPVLRDRVPQGHKVALVDLARGAPVLRYGVPIGHALDAIAAGSWVHERLLQMPEARGLENLPMATARPAPQPALPEEGEDEDRGGGWREWFGIGERREEPDPAKRVPAIAEITCDNASRMSISHVSSDGGTLQNRLRRAGYSFRTAAENTGRGFATGARAVQWWMNSPKHKTNILLRKAREVGVGIAMSDAPDSKLHWIIVVGDVNSTLACTLVAVKKHVPVAHVGRPDSVDLDAQRVHAGVEGAVRAR